VIGGAWSVNGIWPAEYNGVFFYADYVFGKIYTLTPDATAGCRECEYPTPAFVNSTFLETVEPVDVRFAPLRGTQQALYYAKRVGPFVVHRVVYDGEAVNAAPQAVISVSQTVGPLETFFDFDGTESSDPDVGDTLTYEWDFGDGAVSTLASTSHQYSQTGIFLVSLTVTDDSGAKNTAFQEIQVGTPPSVTITSPTATQFSVGDVFTMEGTAFDSNGNSLDDSSLSWEVRQHHATHFHPFIGPISGNSIAMPPAPYPESFLAATNSYLEVRLTATDGDGLKTTVSHDILPITYELDFSTDPSGLSLNIDGFVYGNIEEPLMLAVWENQQITIEAPDQNPLITFFSWSDGGNQVHTITVTGDQSFVAFYDSPEPNTVPYLVTFDSVPQGATSDGPPFSWVATRGGGVFQVESGQLWINDAGPMGVFETASIDSSAVSGSTISVSVDVSSAGNLEPADYAQLVAIVDNVFEFDLGSVAGIINPTTLSGSLTAGSSIVVKLLTQVRLHANMMLKHPRSRSLTAFHFSQVSYEDESYYFDNLSIDVTSGPPPPAPSTVPPTASPTVVPSPAPEPTTAPPPPAGPTASPMESPTTPSPLPPTGSCDVPWTGPDYDIGVTGLTDTQTIDTSCVGDVTIRLELSNIGSLETSGAAVDTFQTFYKIDNNPEQPWLDVLGDEFSTGVNQITVASGAMLQIRTVGDTSAGSETYFVRQFEVVSSSGPPPTPPPGGCDVPWNGPDYVVGNNAFSKTEVLDTSCTGDVKISFSISNAGSLEASGPSMDVLQISYQVDGSSPVSVADVQGGNYSPTYEVIVASSSELKILISGDTTAGSEFYYITDLSVEEV